jgi:hypothetical protein
VDIVIGPLGVDIPGSVVGGTFPTQHQVTFSPAGGRTLKGEWDRKVNCSTRTMDFRFHYNPVLISDYAVTDTGTFVEDRPVIVFPTSVAEPQSKFFINRPDAGPDIAVAIDGPTTPDPVHIVSVFVGPHPPSMAVLHTSAGLRAYKLSAVPQLPDQSLIDSFINIFCDSFHVPIMVVGDQDLRWVEPPPNYGWDHPPLRQWQIVLTNLAADAEITLHAAQDRQRVLASRRDFINAGHAASTTLVTDANTDLVMRAKGASDMARFALMTRWLQPVRRTRLHGDASEIAKVDGDVLLKIDGRWQRFDGATGRQRRISKDLAHPPGQSTKAGYSIKLSRGRVALLNEGHLVIAIPVSFTSRSDVRR